MGGTSPAVLSPVSPAGVKMNDLRLHKSGSEVHLHDDKAGKKFACLTSDFFTGWNEGKKRNFSPPAEIIGHDGKNVPTIAKFESVKVGGVFDVSVTIETMKTGNVINQIDDFIKNS